MNRVLITGSSGLLGSNALNFFAKNYQVGAIYNKREIDVNLKNVKAFYLTKDSLNQIVNLFKPDIIINAAGLTNVEYCQKNHKQAFLANCFFAESIAKISRSLGIKFVHISTDHLWSDNTKFRDESSIPDPINIYAESKLCAEQKVLNANNEAIIIRTNFFGWGPSYRNSFSDFIIFNLLQKNNISLYKDVFFTPIHIDILLRALEKLIKKDVLGIYNVVGTDRVSKFEFGLQLCKKFNLDEGLISKINYMDLKSTVNRPLEMSLSNNKLIKDTDFTEIQLSLNEMIRRLFNNRPNIVSEK